MKFKQNFEDIMKDAKKAFDGIERTSYEKRPSPVKSYIKEVGFVSGTKKVLVWR